MSLKPKQYSIHPIQTTKNKNWILLKWPGGALAFPTASDTDTRMQLKPVEKLLHQLGYKQVES